MQATDAEGLELFTNRIANGMTIPELAACHLSAMVIPDKDNSADRV